MKSIQQKKINFICFYLLSLFLLASIQQFTGVKLREIDDTLSVGFDDAREEEDAGEPEQDVHGAITGISSGGKEHSGDKEYHQENAGSHDANDLPVATTELDLQTAVVVFRGVKVPEEHIEGVLSLSVVEVVEDHAPN